VDHERDPNKHELRQRWARAMAVALRYALYRTRDRSLAEELAGAAVAAALDPERSPWDPQGTLTLDHHVVNLVREQIKAAREKERVREDPLNAAAVNIAMRPEAPQPDTRMFALQRLQRGEARMRAVGQGLDEFARTVLSLFGEDQSPAAQALRLGVPVSRVYEARRRIAERIRSLPANDDDDAPDGHRADGLDRDLLSAPGNGEDEDLS
jgi:DNA-directed RNA polymerase specialized sigma24 family protein